MAKQTQYRMSGFARAIGGRPSSVETMIQLGVIHPTKVGEKGHRRFSEEDRRRAAAYMAAREAIGLPMPTRR